MFFSKKTCTFLTGALLFSGVAPATITEAHYPWVDEAVREPIFMVMNKEQGALRFHSLKDGRLLGQLRAISGLNSGDKVIEGDRKTPEGIYTVQREIPKGNLAKLHGSAAYELNYPNFFDRLEKKTGSGIWIHGVEREDRLDKGKTDTLGCVATGNADILAIRKILRFRETPILIVDKEDASKSVGYENGSGAYTQRLHDWAAAWSSKNIDSYMAFYHPNFKSKGMDFAAWHKYKERLTKVYKTIEVSLSDVKILVHPKYSVAYFIQNYKSNRLSAISRKRVLLIGAPAEAKILLEEVTQESLSTDEAPVLGATEDESVALSKK